MNQKKFFALTAITAVVLAAGVWLSMHRSNQQAAGGGGSVFADLKAALSEIEEIRLSKGDGSRTTLHRNAEGWTVMERHYPADSARVRELAMGLASLRVIVRNETESSPISGSAASGPGAVLDTDAEAPAAASNSPGAPARSACGRS